MLTIVDSESMALDLGASDYLIKPVDRERLALLIEKHRVNDSSAPKTIKLPVSLTRNQNRPKEEIGLEAVRRS